MEKPSTISVFRWCSFVILALVSLFFIYNLSVSLVINPVEKIVIVSGAVGLEFFKLYSIITAGTYAYVGKHLGIKTRKRAFLYFTYIWVSLYSVLASFGYSVTAVDKMQTSVTVMTHESSILLEEENIKNYTDNISEYKITKSGYDNSKTSYLSELISAVPAERDAINKKISSLDKSSEDTQKKIDALMDKKSKAQENIDNYKKEDLTATKTINRTMYDVISDTIKVPAKTIAFVILLIFSSSVELGIFTTAPHANKIDNMKFDEEEIISNKPKKRAPPRKKPEQKKEILEIKKVEPVLEPKKEVTVEVKKEAPVPEPKKEVIVAETQKIEKRTPEEILESLDTDRPAITKKAKEVAKRI